MGRHEMQKEFYKRLKENVKVDQEEHTRKVRQSLINHKHRAIKTDEKGKENADVR